MSDVSTPDAVPAGDGDGELLLLGLGLGLERLWLEQPGVRLGDPALEDAELSELTDELRGALDDARRVIVIQPDWFGDEAWRRLQTVHSLLDTDRVMLHRTALPPLAASVAAALTAAAGAHLQRPGAVAAALPQIERELIVLAWLGRVNGLRRPAPSVGQHAKSALPSSAFMAVLHPDERVHTLGGPGSELPLARVPEPMELLMAPWPDGDVDWVVEVANPALGGLRLREIDALPDAPGWWGTDRLVELAAYPTDVASLARRVAPAALSACRWCREPIAASPCPFCGERAAGAA